MENLLIKYRITRENPAKKKGKGGSTMKKKKSIGLVVILPVVVVLISGIGFVGYILLVILSQGMPFLAYLFLNCQGEGFLGGDAVEIVKMLPLFLSAYQLFKVFCIKLQRWLAVEKEGYHFIFGQQAIGCQAQPPRQQ